MQPKYLIVAIAAVLTAGSSIAYCKTVEPQISPRSMQLTLSGEALLGDKKALAAIDQFETALAVDPKNVRAYIGMARAHEAVGLPGRAVRFYREALSIDPNDLTALEEQGGALVARGAMDRAKENLARIRKLCGGECGQAKRLSGVITKGPPPVETASADKNVKAAPKLEKAN